MSEHKFEVGDRIRLEGKVTGIYKNRDATNCCYYIDFGNDWIPSAYCTTVDRKATLVEPNKSDNSEKSEIDKAREYCAWISETCAEHRNIDATINACHSCPVYAVLGRKCKASIPGHWIIPDAPPEPVFSFGDKVRRHDDETLGVVIGKCERGEIQVLWSVPDKTVSENVDWHKPDELEKIETEVTE